MKGILGYIVCGNDNLYTALGAPDSEGPGPYLCWPPVDAKEFSMPVSVWNPDEDEVRAYIARCRELGEDVRLYAYAEDEAAFRLCPWFGCAQVLGYDCVGEDSKESCLYWDNPQASFPQEMAELGLRLNAHLHFDTYDEAERYGQMRRAVLKNGENIQDIGPELSIAIARIDPDEF